MGQSARVRRDPLPLGRPVTAARALELGVTDKVLRGPRVRRVLRGVYVAADVPDSLQLRCEAAGLVIPRGAALSHETSVALRRLPLPLGHPEAEPALHVTVPQGRARVRIPGIVAHEAAWLSGDVVRLRGLALTSVGRTWCDLACTGWRRDDLVAYADAVLRRAGPAGLDALSQRVECWPGQRGVRVLREALELCAFRVDSAMETRLRLGLHDAGLPAPEVNEPVRDGFGDVVHRPDLSWRQYRYALDYDGAHHLEFDDPAAVLAGRRTDWRRRHDISRQEQLRELGWTLTVVTAYDLLREPDTLIARVRRELRDRGAPC